MKRQGNVQGVRFSPDGNTLVAFEEKGLIFMDLPTHRVWNLPLEDNIRLGAWSGNGKLLALGGTKGKDPESKIGVIKLLNMDIASWPQMACRSASRNLTKEEWRRYMGDDVPYHKTCPDLPGPEEEKP